MTVLLKKFMAEAGALLGDSTGFNKLYDVLVEMILGTRKDVSTYQATIATATIASFINDRARTLKEFAITAADTGSAGDTDVQIQVGGVNKKELTIDNTDANGILKSDKTLDVAVAADVLVEIVVTAAPTAGTGLTATAVLAPDITVES